ncbi:DUF6240 domain-containing protein [Schnuerera ultunensis]|uniref:Flagellar hook-length control protein-like C-terminal domain-containing protein n=1 Tax=[Clostridium] ultunense Esp TaxID=1288971 RepID=A0A1M4PKT3_9FIRM|nr:DUF6240 domain-containing protein [Schnuerera ultunensis]SHD76090.1 conserved protein of unknown function [[Clostridium] ultunense Esp]
MYSLRVKEEIQQTVGKKVQIDKENILSMKVEEKEEEIKPVNFKEIIERIGLEDSEETIKGIEYLIDNKIPVTKENLETFFMSKKYLGEIIENIDFDSCIQLMERGINLKEDSLQKIAETLIEIKDIKRDISFKDLIRFDRKLSYKEAEIIAKEIYGRKMGKDVYDSILALHKERIPINRENIERVMEVIDRLYDLKDYNDETFVKFFKEDLPFNIESLYKYKHSYNNKNLDKNIISPLYEEFTIEKEETLKYVLKILEDLNLEAKGENIQLIREFLLNGVEVTLENYQRLLNMKSNLKELIDLLDEEKVVYLMDEGVDILKEDISILIEKIKDKGHIEPDIGSDKSSDLLKEIESLRTITDKELLQLIKNEEDFKIENLKEIISTNTNLVQGLNGKIVEKARTITNIFNTLGGLDSDTIAFASKKFNTITLNNLYDSHLELNTKDENIVEPIAKTEESLIRQEYLNAKSNTKLNLIKISVKEGVALEHMPLEELNLYIDRKVNRYRETQRSVNEIKYLKGKEHSLIPIVMKNHLNMSISQINNIDSILNNGKGIGNIFNNLLNNKGKYSEELKGKIEILENKIKEFSNSIKKGKGEVKEDFKETINAFKDLNNSSNSNDREREENLKEIEEYLKLQNQLSKEDLILQLPVFTEEGYNNINLIIPNINRGIQKNNMVFYLNMNMKNLGEVKFNLQVKDEKVDVEFNAVNVELIKENENILKDGLEKIGYTLEKLKPNNIL